MKHYTISFTSETIEAAEIIEMIEDRITMYDYKIDDLIVNETDVAATMGTPPDGETALDVADEKFRDKLENDSYFDPRESHNVQEDFEYGVNLADVEPTTSIQALFEASELLARHSEQQRESNERIISLLEEIADYTFDISKVWDDEDDPDLGDETYDEL